MNNQARSRFNSGASDLIALPQPWRERGLRFALHLGVVALDKPLFKNCVGTLDPIDHIGLAAELGFAGVTDNMLKVRLTRDQSSMGEELARLGLIMGSFANTPMGSGDPRWGDPASNVGEIFLASILESIAAGRRVGGKVINVFAALTPGIPRSRQFDVFGERLRRVADRVARADMVLAVEPISASRAPGLLVHHTAEVRAMIGADHPALRLLFDTAHIQEMDGDLIDAFRSSKDLMTDIVQLANVRDRLEPGSGDTDFVTFLRCLQSDGFHGLLELEHYIHEDNIYAEHRALARLGEIVSQV